MNAGTRVTVGTSGRRRVPEVLPRRDRHLRRVPPDLQERDRGVRQDRRQLRRDSGRLRRTRRGRPSEEHVGHVDDGGRAQDAVGTGGAGQDRALEPDPAQLARSRGPSSAPASTRERSTTSPRRSSARPRRAAATTPPAKTTTSSSRASAATRTRSATSASRTGHENKDKLKLAPSTMATTPTVRDRSCRRPRASRPAPSPLSRPIFIYLKLKALDRPGGEELRGLLPEQGHPAHPRGRLHSAPPTRR